MDLISFDQLAAQCAPSVSVVTLRKIARVESAFNPNALSLNYPKRTAAKAGHVSGYAHLSRQPKSRSEAVKWASALIAQGHSVSIGLVQVSSQHLAEFSVSLERAFDPCTNLSMGGALLSRKYRAAVARWGEGQQALSEAFSTYNSGSTELGFSNGYVGAVRGSPTKSQSVDSSGLIAESASLSSLEAQAMNAPTSVPWKK